MAREHEDGAGTDAAGEATGPGRFLRIGFGLERLGALALVSPRGSLVVLAIAIAIGVLGVSRLQFDNDLRNLYRTDSPESRLLDTLVDLFPVVENQVVLLVSGDRLTSRDGLDTLRTIHLDLGFVDGVKGIVSPFSARRPPVGDAVPEPVFPADLPDGEALARLVEAVQQHPLLGNKVLSADGKSALVIVYLDPALSSARVAQDIQASVAETLALGNPAGLVVSATGGPIIRAEILGGVKRDQVVLNLLGVLVALVLCFLYFREPRAVVIAVAPGVVGVAWTLGGLGLVGHPLNAMNNVLPTLVLVLTFADSLHMMDGVRRHLGRGAGSVEAAREAVARIGPACAMTSVTTAIVFMSLALSDSPTIREFGYAGAWAAVSAFLSVITVVPTLCAVAYAGGAGRFVEAGEGLLGQLTRKVAGVAALTVAAAPRTIAVLGLVAIGFASAGYLAVDTHYSYRDFLPDGSPSSATIDRIDAELGGVDTVVVLIRALPGTASDTAPGPVVRAVHDTVTDFPEFGSVFSLRSIEAWLGHRLDLAQGQIEIGRFALPDHFVGQLGSEDGNAWLVSAYMKEMSSARSAPLLDRLDAALDPVRKAAPGYRIDITGVVPMTDRSSKRLIWSLNVSLVAAIAVTIALIALTLRSALLGGLAALPNFLPLAVAGSFLYLTGDGLQITSVVALTVAFGIAVDDTIHLVHDWRRRHAGGDNRANVIDSLARVGPVLVATTVVLAFGFTTTAASAMPIVRTFGFICVLTIAVALIADLFLMPALLIVCGRWLGTGRTGS